MALLGNRGGMFGGGGLVATREDLERQRRMEAVLGQGPVPVDAQPVGARSMLPAVQEQPHWNLDLPDFASAPRPANPAQPQQRSLDPEVMKLIGQAPVRKNNTGRDIIAGILATIADVAAARGGRQGTAVDGLVKTWGDRRDTYKTQQQQYDERMRIAGLPGMGVREMAAYMADPKAWGSNMSRAATSPYDAATLNPGDTRFLGVGNGSVQAPTRGQQYAQSLGLEEGSDPYNNAIRDQELGANGPTGFGNSQALENLRTGNRRGLEAQRQANRVGLEGVRQNNRMGVRGAPTYRDLNPPPPRVSGPGRAAPRRSAMPTATGPNGEKVQWNGRAWVPAQ